MKKTRTSNIIVWSLLALYLFSSLRYADSKRAEVACDTVMVSIVDETGNQFVKREDIISLLNDKNEKTMGERLADIDAHELESITELNTAVRNAEVYKTNDGSLHIDVEQRDPMMRVYCENGHSFYIDAEGVLMPLSGNYTKHVQVASGYIPETNSFDYGKYEHEGAESVYRKRHKRLADVYLIVKAVQADEFLNRQIEQVYALKEGGYELIPKVGMHRVLLGGIEDYREKLWKLKVIYQQGLPYTGWDKYELINLKYKNQVVCKKRNNYEQ